MDFDPELALIRFGTGLTPRFARPESIDAILGEVVAPDTLAQRYEVPGFDDAEPSFAAMAFINRAERDARDTIMADAARQARQVMRQQLGPARRDNHLATFARAVEAEIGLRERLVAFWADHFTVTRRQLETQHLVASYVGDAIRPHVAGSFPAMLRAVVMHPMMLLYLEQTKSVGPNSEMGQRRGGGLNENLARELLELHLLGVDGQYTQTDVRELAELLTGITFAPHRGVGFDPDRAEPGDETVLGQTFGADPDLETVMQALDQLAVLPATARHLAHKLAVHFISPRPDAGLIAAMVDGFGPTGDLFAMTEAMLNHPAAWGRDKAKVRQPTDYLVACLRALSVTGDQMVNMMPANYRRMILRPLKVMGQPWQAAPGPDGWPEAAEDWIIPQAMAARITWAMVMPRLIVDRLPDPRDFVRVALGETPPAEVAFAAAASENRRDGVGVILASAAFQRR